MSDAPQKFTGRARRRTTSWTVALGDRLARGLITVGGIGTIVAVLLVCVYLFSVVLPLFEPAKIERVETLSSALPAAIASKADVPKAAPMATAHELGADRR